MPTRIVRLEAILTSDTTPISGKTIAFKYRPSGAGTWIDAGTEITDTNGKASLSVPLTVPASYDFRVEFAGDADYEASYAEVTNYKVKAKTTISLTVTPL